MSGKSLSEVHGTVEIGGKRNFFRTLYAFIGPAYLVSVGYMDPGNWATDIAGGSRFGYQLIWVLLMSNLMAMLLQSLASRLGVVRGLDLAQASRIQYPAWVNFSLYVFAEIAIAACDLAEIIGMAIGLNLLFGLPLIAGVLITALDTFVLLFLLNRGIRKMEAFILSLVTIIGVSFFIEMLIVKPDVASIVKGAVPSILTDDALYIAIGIIGATVMPHNLYLHSALVQTRKFARDEAGIKKAIRFNILDSVIALNLAFLVNSAILILAAAAFYKNGLYHVAGIEDAHVLLQNIFGSFAPALFAIALIASGQSSTITGTLAGQIVMEGYLDLRISPWVRRLLTRLIAIIPAIGTILWLGSDRLGDLLVLSQVILSIQLGFAVIPLIHFVSSKSMGKFRIGKATSIAAWTAAGIILALNIRLIIEELVGFFAYLGPKAIVIQMLTSLLVIFAAVLLVYIIIEPFLRKIYRRDTSLPHGGAADLSQITKPGFTRIALTVDFTSHDRKTIEHALMMGGTGASYLLIHIVESAGAMRSGEDIIDQESQHDRQYLKTYERQLKQLGYNVSISLGYGKAANVIPQMINASDWELLVMGAHGHKGVKDILFGSTIDKVRHQVQIPVFIVK